MSHNLFLHFTFCSARVWLFLKRVDVAEAETCVWTGCPHCGGWAAWMRHRYRLRGH